MMYGRGPGARQPRRLRNDSIGCGPRLAPAPVAPSALEQTAAPSAAPLGAATVLLPPAPQSVATDEKAPPHVSGPAAPAAADEKTPMHAVSQALPLPRQSAPVAVAPVVCGFRWTSPNRPVSTSTSSAQLMASCGAAGYGRAVQQSGGRQPWRRESSEEQWAETVGYRRGCGGALCHAVRDAGQSRVGIPLAVCCCC
jgi:hypothetical protein